MALNPMFGLVPDNPDLVLFVDKALDRIHSKAVPILQQELKKRDIVLTETLLKGLSRSVNRLYQEKVIEYIIKMDTHGRFNDFKTTRYSGRPNFNTAKKNNGDGAGFFDYALESYQKHGFKKVKPFSTLPAYALKSPEASVRYMAFGAIVNIAKKATVRHPSSRSNWFKVYFEKIIGPMNDSLLDAAEAVAMKEAEHVISKVHGDRSHTINTK